MTADPSPIVIEPAAPDSADATACLSAYFAELEIRFGTAFDPEAGATSPDAAMVPPSGAFLIARRDGSLVGCGGVKRIAAGIGEIKRMWIAPEMRGRGFARTLLAAIEDQARKFGLTTIRLDTNRALTEAQAMYLKNGYRPIPRYNDNPYADFWFEKAL